MSGLVSASDKLFSHDALPCLGTLGPCNGREDKGGVAEGKKQRTVTYVDEQVGKRDGGMSNGGDGSYCDNGKIERDREGSLGGGRLVLGLFNRLAVFS